MMMSLLRLLCPAVANRSSRSATILSNKQRRKNKKQKKNYSSIKQIIPGERVSNEVIIQQSHMIGPITEKEKKTQCTQLFHLTSAVITSEAKVCTVKQYLSFQLLNNNSAK
jgi:hypothetical protein